MYDNLLKSPLQRVFVYGTLKRGEPNFGFLTNKENGYAKRIGFGKTLLKYPLVISTKYNIPFMLQRPGIGNQITGEVYDVDSKMLKILDDFEGHPEFYVRTEIDIFLASESDLKNEADFEKVAAKCKAWIYILPKFRESMLELPMYSSYSTDGPHGLKYSDSYLSDPTFDHKKEVGSELAICSPSCPSLLE